MKRFSIFAVLACGLALLGACDGSSSSGPPSIASIAVAAPADSLVQGASMQLSLTLRDESGAEVTGRAVEWASDNPAVARVEGAGVVTGAAPGLAKITATVEGQSGSFAVRVVPRVVPIGSVDLGVSRLSLYAGQVVQLSATARDAAGLMVTGRPVLWATDDSTIASVTQTGLVTVKRAGQVGVSASVGGVFALVKLELYASNGHAWPDTVAFSPGTTRQLRARSISLAGEPIALDSVRWESSNPSVATVDARGEITAVSPGRAEIAAVLGTTRFTSSVNVVTYPTPLRFTWVGVGVRHACALATDGQAYCWGGNEQSQLATDQPTDRCETVTNLGRGSFIRNTFRCSGMPVAVNGGLRFTTLAVSSSNTCGLTEEGAVYCWGSNHKNRVPVAVGGSLRLRTLSAGSSMMCGISAAGSAYCWSEVASTPAEVPGGLTFRSVNAGGTHACGIASNGAAYCWGTNFYGQLGNGNTKDSAMPVAVTRGTQFSAIEAGSSITCALDAAGKAYCWGYRTVVVSGQSVDSSTPVAGARDLTFASLLDGGTPCGLTADGNAFCWANDLAAPVRSGPPFPARSIASGIGIECAIALDGITQCAGVRWQGQTGAGFIDSQNTGYTRVARQ